MNLKRNIKRPFTWLISARAVFYSLPPLMLILVMGTIAQKDIGLYQAQKTYFSSFIIWPNSFPIPLPGGYLIMGFITVCLSLQFLFKTSWKREKLGIALSHLGVLILLYGGWITAVQSHEGYVMLFEGDKSRVIHDYQQRILSITNDQDTILTLPFNEISDGLEISQNLPFTVTVLRSCQNCMIESRDTSSATLPLQDMAKGMSIFAKPLEKNNEENLHGLEVSITGTGVDPDTQDGLYVLLEDIGVPASIETDTGLYTVTLTRKSYPLPFSVLLKDFRQTLYPGTDKAKSYESDVILTDGDQTWLQRIEMNTPLRYRGYTLFQSSYLIQAGREATVLAVVKNKGWIFPYIGTVFIGFGLLLQCFLHRRGKA